MRNIIIHIISLFTKHPKKFRNKYVKKSPMAPSAAGAPAPAVIINNWKKHYCPFCREWFVFGDGGIEHRPDAGCPKCGSVERHRFLYLLYKKIIPRGNKAILHFAPEPSLYNLIGARNPNYVAVDAMPELFPYIPNVKRADGMNLPFPDKSFDFVIHNQVIEHVPDDKSFIAECLRVLKDGGKLLINLPYDRYSQNDFAPATTDAERLERFGQSDHVRLYGGDFLDHLRDDRWDIERIMEEDIADADAVKFMKLKRYVYLQDAYLVITKRLRP